MAAARPIASADSIWEIVLNVAARGGAVRKRPEEGHVDLPDEGDWPEVMDTAQAAWAAMIQLIYEVDPLLCECGATLELVDIIEARTQSDVVGKILKHINYSFDALPLPARPPPAVPSRAGRSSGRRLPTRRLLLLIRFRRPSVQDLSFPAASLDNSSRKSYLQLVFQAQFAENLASGPCARFDKPSPLH